MIVQNGVLVEAVKTRTMPIAVSTLTQGQVTRTRPIQEVVVAIDPLEVAPLTQAIATNADVQSVIRSGHPDDPADSVTPGARPRSPLQGLGEDDGAGFRMVEAIDGTGRRYIAVRAAEAREDPLGPASPGPESLAEGADDGLEPRPDVAAPPPGWTPAGTP